MIACIERFYDRTPPKNIIGVRISCQCSDRGSITLDADANPKHLEFFMQCVRDHGCVPMVEDVLLGVDDA